jgi:hypothetical protein
MTEGASVTGGCYCGAVRFRVQLPTLFCGHCHCSICRRSHAAGFVTWFAIPREQLSFEQGADRLVHFQSSPHGTRSFCGRCGTTMLCESTHSPDVVDIALATIEGPLDRGPEAHVYFDDRASWVSVNDNLPRLGGASGLEPKRR